MRSSFLFVLLASSCISRAQYSGPESCEYDALADRWLISNTSDNTIKQRSSGGTVTLFVSTPAAPYGLEIQGDTLFACEAGSIRGYLLSNGDPVFDLDLGGTFLNGLTSDGTFLYATDYNTKKIFKVDVAAQSFSTLVSNTVFTPNGIVYDPVQDRLVAVSWGANATIKAVNKNTGAISPLTTTTVTNIDGITIDCMGYFIVSSWSPDHLTRFEPTFASAGVDMGVTGLNNPADIDFDAVHGHVCVPNSGSNTVTLAAVPDCSLGIHAANDGTGYVTVNAVPNPTDGLINIDLPLAEPTPFMVMNERGLLVASGTLKPRAMLDVSNLASGIYVIDLPRIKRYVRVVKR